MTKLTRRGVSALLAATALTPGLARAALAPEAQALIGRIEAYLNSITTLKSRFSQVNPNGTASAGTVYVDRSRHGMLFDYDPPSKITLIAPGDWRLIFMDGSIEQVNVLPVNETPLGFLLADQVRIGGDLAVTDLVRERGEILLTVTRAGAEDQGHVLLAFIERPIELRRWAVTDPQGLTTVVILEDLQLNQPLESSLFTFKDPKIFGWPSQ